MRLQRVADANKKQRYPVILARVLRGNHTKRLIQERAALTTGARPICYVSGAWSPRWT